MSIALLLSLSFVRGGYARLWVQPKKQVCCDSESQHTFLMKDSMATSKVQSIRHFSLRVPG